MSGQASVGRTRVSLRLQVAGWLLLINSLVFVAGGVWVKSTFEDAQAESARWVYDDLIYRLRDTIAAAGQINVKRILADPIWASVDDAMIVDKGLRAVPTGGVATELIPFGVALNPVGAARREARWGGQLILAGLAEAMETGEVVEVAGGRAIHIEDRGELWGAFWYRMPEAVLKSNGMFGRLFPWFTLSTLLLTGGSFMLLSRFALAPLQRLAAGVRQLESGELSARIQVGSAAAEFEDLMRGFNTMADEVEGFSARLEGEVERATLQAHAAEKAALTQRRLAAMGELTAGIAHEINNPLGGLLNAAAALERADLPAERRARYIRLLIDGLERIRDTVGGLLRFTPRETAAGPVDLLDVVADSMALVRHRALGLGVELDLVVQGEAAGFVLHGSRNELGQAVLNLLGNSLDALEEAGAAGRIEVGLESLPVDRDTAPSLVLSVEDNGPGVDAEILEKVADLFFTTKEVGKGSGLGLGIVHRTVDAHGGSILITSTRGVGFRVRIEFPRDMIQ